MSVPDDGCQFGQQGCHMPLVVVESWVNVWTLDPQTAPHTRVVSTQYTLKQSDWWNFTQLASCIDDWSGRLEASRAFCERLPAGRSGRSAEASADVSAERTARSCRFRLLRDRVAPGAVAIHTAVPALGPFWVCLRCRFPWLFTGLSGPSHRASGPWVGDQICSAWPGSCKPPISGRVARRPRPVALA